MPFTCSICGEESTRICARCTKDTCGNHLCEKCLRCSDCCECEIALAEPVHETARYAFRSVNQVPKAEATIEHEPEPPQPPPDPDPLPPEDPESGPVTP